MIKSNFYAVANGILRLSNRELLPFSPSLSGRNKLAVAYDSAAISAEIRGNPTTAAALIPQTCHLITALGWGFNSHWKKPFTENVTYLPARRAAGNRRSFLFITGIIGNAEMSECCGQGCLGDRFEIGRLTGKIVALRRRRERRFLNKTHGKQFKKFRRAET